MSKPYNRSTQHGHRFRTRTWDHVSQGASSFRTVNWVDQASGHTNEHWQERIALKDEVTSTFNATKVSIESTEGVVASRGWVNNSPIPSNFREGGIEGSLGAEPFSGVFSYPSGSGTDRALSEAGSSYISEARDMLTQIEGGELLGEMKQTVKAIQSTSHAMVSLLFDWKRAIAKAASRHRGKVNRRRFLGNAGDAYLQWKFGWDPLRKDVMTLLGPFQKDQTGIFPFKAYGRGSGVSSSSVTGGGSVVGCSYRKVTTVTEEVSVRYDAAIAVTMSGLGDFTEQLGISPRNFVPTLYNLLPWTYMLDYFTNTGQIVQRFGFDWKRIAHSSRSIRQRRTETITSGINPVMSSGIGWINAPGYPIVVPATTKIVTQSYSRTAAMPDGWPGLTFRFPTVGSEAGRTIWKNIAAVLAAKTFGDSRIVAVGD